jgi:hypothetical protein
VALLLALALVPRSDPRWVVLLLALALVVGEAVGRGPADGDEVVSDASTQV